MGKRRRKKTESCSSSSQEPLQKPCRLRKTERHILCEPMKRQKCKKELVQAPRDELIIQAQEMNEDDNR